VTHEHGPPRVTRVREHALHDSNPERAREPVVRDDIDPQRRRNDLRRPERPDLRRGEDRVGFETSRRQVAPESLGLADALPGQRPGVVVTLPRGWVAGVRVPEQV
jgi:hypothetical protein